MGGDLAAQEALGSHLHPSPSEYLRETGSGAERFRVWVHCRGRLGADTVLLCLANLPAQQFSLESLSRENVSLTQRN